LFERQLKDSSAVERKEQRLEKSLHIINELGRWISEENRNVLPSLPLGKAFYYTINLWDSL
jgi:transposase